MKVTAREARAGFGGREVIAFESRRSAEIASIIESYGGRPRVAPSMREVPMESNPEALAFADELLSGSLDIVIFMTGVGARYLLELLETHHPIERLVAALNQTLVVARGPKPVKALREAGVTIGVT